MGSGAVCMEVFDMLPFTARRDDYVEVINENHEYYGMIGKIYNIYRDGIIVDFYGKKVVFSREDLKMAARVGTNKHKELELRNPNNLTKEDFNELIDFALALRDWEWVEDLVKRRDGKQ